MGTPVLPERAGNIGNGETESKCEQSFSVTVDAGDMFMVSQEDTVVASDTGARAYLVSFSWLARHYGLLERRGIPRVATNPSKARFRFRDGRPGEVR